jgi:hypothetical protein
MKQDASFATARVLVVGSSSVGMIAVASMGVGAMSPSSKSDIWNDNTISTSVHTELKEKMTNQPVEPDPEPDQESYTESSDGISQTRQYRSTSTDTNGTRISEERTYTTNIDGGSAIDIKLDTNSSSNGSASNSSSSSASINISSSFENTINP